MSLTGQFDLIDSYILDNRMKEALSELKSVEKKLYDSWSYLGVYKRYVQLGENTSAENILKKAIKKNSSNVELIAVYSKFLIQQNRFDEALKLSEKLTTSSRYASIYSEALLKKMKSDPVNKDPALYKNPDLNKIYVDAYKTSKNHVWLRNSAIFSLQEGYFDVAASLLPGSFSDSDDAYFWGQVLFDAGMYYEAVNALEISKKYLKDFPNTFDRSQTKVSEIQLVALESDAFIALSDMERAESQRQTIISKLDTLKNISDADKILLPVIAVNSAVYAENIGDNDTAADMLFYSVTEYPEFTQGLLMYADFAYRSNLEREEDEEMKTLRRNGLVSIEMEKYDNRRKIPLSDAVYRIDAALEKQKNPYLSIAKLDLKYKTGRVYSVEEKTADLWHMLENNYSQSVKYEDLLVQYTLSYLLKTDQIDDAYMLFKRYMHESYGIPLTAQKNKADFWQEFIRILPKVNLRSAEFGAWFAAHYRLYDEAFRIYEYCVYESGGILSEGFVSPYVSSVSCMNLADMYYSTGNKAKALDLYGKSAGRESNNYLRSEMFYRIACIYVETGDRKNALRSIDYAASIYPNNARAQLLKTKLKD